MKKKILALVLVISFVMSMFALSFTSSAVSTLKGDADGDGKVTLTDARITVIASAGIIELTEAQKSACDVITTGADKNVITTADARRILRTAAGLK